MPRSRTTAEQSEWEKTLVSYRVVGALPIVDAVTRAEVYEGGTVRLDPARTIIDALIEGGSLAPLEE